MGFKLSSILFRIKVLIEQFFSICSEGLLDSFNFPVFCQLLRTVVTIIQFA